MSGFGAGLAGLSAVPEGYTWVGMDMEKLQEMQLKRAGMEAFGRAFQQQFPTAAGPPPGPGGPGGPGGMPGMSPMTGTGPVMPGAPPPMAGSPMSVGPPGGSPAAPPPMASGPPGFAGASMLTGAPRPPMAGMPPGPSPSGAPPMGAGPPMGGPRGMPSGGQPSQYEPGTWQWMADRIAKANPGAPPAVIASAVTQAMPLMQTQSQQDWRRIQTLLAQERLDVSTERAAETGRHNRALEGAREEG